MKECTVDACNIMISKTLCMRSHSKEAPCCIIPFILNYRKVNILVTISRSTIAMR
jgi:hypothetical protein